MSTPDYENMSDDELMSLMEPEGDASASPDQADDADNTDTTDPLPASDSTPEDEPMFVEGDGETLEDKLANPDDASADATNEVTESQAEGDESKDGEEESTESSTDGEAQASETSEGDLSETTPDDQAAEAKNEAKQSTADSQENDVDYKAAYEQIMAPFKANGKMLQVKSPEEVISLMQHGANYTKKMHALKPNLKMMRMLENNGLLQEDKLNHLIELSNKNPEAIAKLLKDAEMDPLDIDTSAEKAYQPKDHSVSDQEMDFQSTLEDVLMSATGSETISVINSQWDQASKEAIYKEPQIMQVIDTQRANGIYDRISAEIERRRTLGTLSHSTPFIHAYKQVGDELHNSGQLVPQNSGNQGASKVIETRSSSPRKAVSNGDKAKAASPARAAPKSSPKPFDPFSLSDEEIMAIPTQFS